LHSKAVTAAALQVAVNQQQLQLGQTLQSLTAETARASAADDQLAEGQLFWLALLITPRHSVSQ